jgi:hypothetical protein
MNVIVILDSPYDYGDAVAYLVEASCYKPECRGFDS